MNNILDIITGDVNISQKERIISVAGGVALVLLGIMSVKKKPATAWPEIGTGAALLLRGVTGHCAVTAAMGKNTAVTEAAKEAENKFESLAE